MLPVTLEYPPGVRNGFRVYRPARGGRLCERFGGYKTINQIPLLKIQRGKYVAHGCWTRSKGHQQISHWSTIDQRLDLVN